MTESANVRTNEFADKNGVERKKKLGDYKNFVFLYKDALDTLKKQI